MYEIIEQHDDILEAVGKFRNLIRGYSIEDDVKVWSFPTQGEYSIRTYKLSSPHGDLAVGLPKDPLDGRFLHLFTALTDAESLSPQVEINIHSGAKQSVSGLYVKDGKNILLCTKGKFHHIKTEIALAHFSDRLIDIQDANKISSVIVVGELGSPNFVEKMVDFVKGVVDLKKKHGKKMQ